MDGNHRPGQAAACPWPSFMTGAAVSPPDGQVFLFWFGPLEDDSITGYQILRGPKADSLVVIEEDTGIDFDQLHGRLTPACGPDPHLRREGP